MSLLNEDNSDKEVLKAGPGIGKEVCVNIEEEEAGIGCEEVVVQKTGMEEEVIESGCEEEEAMRDMEMEEDSTCEVIELSEETDVIDETGEYSLNHTFLVELRQHLTSRHGRSRTEREARQISVEIAKYLNFSGPLAKPHNLYDPTKLDKYLKYLEKQGKKASTQHAILCRIKQGLSYVNLSLDPAETVKAEKCMTFMNNWISALGKEARRVNRIHLEDMSDNVSSSMTTIDEFCRSEEMCQALNSAVGKVKKGEQILAMDIRKL